eukprot:11378034-Ditylum_brightwellii.AAC.1
MAPMLFSIKRGLGPVRVSSITSEVKVEEKSLSSSEHNPEDFAYGKLHAHWKAISPPQSPRVM